jgi:hypothetical protein
VTASRQNHDDPQPLREAIYSASPAASLAAERADIEFYLSVYEACLDELVA